VRGIIHDFHTVLGENPVGTNAEIMAALNGRNLKQARLGPPPNQNVNDEGELLDRWGTPYFFHQLSKDTMEIRSAGADRRMWSKDDLLVK
jgi:hypothetical protein